MKNALVLTAILVTVIVVIVVYMSLKSKTPVDKGLATYQGKIADYKGDKKLLVAFTASWSSVWIMSAEALKQLDKSKYDLAILDDAVDHEEIKEFGVTFLTTVALIEHGRISQMVQNLSSIDQIKNW